MAAILSPEILRLVAHHIEYSNSTTRRSDIAAFALGARALARAADPYRLRAVRVDGLADLQNFYRSVQMEWRDLGGSLSELVVRFGPSNGKGKARNCGAEDQLAASASPTTACSATELLGLALKRTRRLTKLDIKVDSSSIAVDEVLPSLTANCRSLRHISLSTSSPLSTDVLDKFLLSQPHLTDLELPNQFQAYPPEPIVVSPPPPQKSFKVVTGDGRRKRLRLTIPRPGVSETEVDEDYDCEMEDTDVEEEDEMGDDDRVALFHPYPPRTNSKIVMPVEILDDEPTSPPTLKAAVIPSSPRPSLKRKAVDDY
ncbi:hypothetical protein FRC00_001591 [Tulasnella sp. 408]|nr:hypothetical protein FRC00_001591 [Tulasnella sp. 408]